MREGAEVLTKPIGKTAVRDALIGAGAKLFAMRSPEAVSVREIAKEAGVNHGLVHRHFGSKAGLLKAVMTQLAADVSQDMGPSREGESMAEVLVSAFRATSGTQGGGQHLRILARTLLDGGDPAELQSRFPVVERLLASAKRDNATGLSDEALVTLIVTMALGLKVFEPYLKLATGQDDAKWQATRNELIRLAMRSMGGQ